MAKMKAFHFYFDTETDNRLDALAKYHQTSRAGVLRDLVSYDFERLAGELAAKRPAGAVAAPYAGERKEVLG